MTLVTSKKYRHPLSKATKPLTSLAIALLVCLSIVSCRKDWATANKPVSNITEIAASISSSNKGMAELTESQKQVVFESLAGPVKNNFEAVDLKPKVIACWGRTSGQVDEGKVFLVRYSIDGKTFSILGINQLGNVFESSSGNLQNGRLLYEDVALPEN